MIQLQQQATSRLSPTKSSSSSSNLNTVIDLNDENYLTYHHKKLNGSFTHAINFEQENSTNELSSNDDIDSSKTSLSQNSNESDEVNYSSLNHQNVLIEKHGGLSNKNVLLILILWYILSGFTLYTNKYIVSHGKGDPTLLGAVQMAITSLCGFIQININKFKYKKLCNINNNNNLNSISQTSLLQNGLNNSNNNFFVLLLHKLYFWRDMLIVGALRLFSIILGLMALKQASISFVETIKSSSPLFTVIISRILIGEVTGFWTNVSIIPIMVGLALCSSFEINFSIFGFLAAIFTNLTECLQMVFSKLLLCGEKYKYSPLELQFFTSFASCIVLVPICLYTIDVAATLDILTIKIVFLFFLNGFLYHAQTFLAFTLMSYISPVTYSVCNTLKRALLIWVSVLIFQNNVAYLSAIGTLITIVGVLAYNHVRHIEHARLTKSQQTRKNTNN